ncbi:hypothetical protein JZU48_04885, partial [bacterium]|nr:hypothetical protein [bacterium]
GLRRWWKRETARRARADLRSAISASEKFDTKLDKRALDTRAANALRAAFWNAISNRDMDSIETLGKLVLDYNADDRNSEKLQRSARSRRTNSRSLRFGSSWPRPGSLSRPIPRK